MTPPPATLAGSPAAAPPAAPPAGRPVTGGLLALAALLLIAVNLRIAITSLGALLDEVRTGLHFSQATAGLVTTLPTVAFAGFGAVTPWLVRRFAPARILMTAMLALTAGQLLRATTGSTVVFLATSALALAGIAVANILLPMLVKKYFAHRTGLVTGAYTMGLTVGTTVAAATTVPIAHAIGSWRPGLGVWALLAGVTALGAPLTLILAALVTRLRTLHAVVATFATASTVAYLGLILAPHDGALLWVLLLAIGQLGFPLILAVIGLRSRTARGTVALSAFTQSTGYLIAALGPLLVGMLYGLTGGWTAPIALLLVALVVQTTAGFTIARPRFVEDER